MKKDFIKKANEKDTLGNTTRTFLGLEQEETPVMPEEQKKPKTSLKTINKFKKGANKTKSVSVRVSEEIYDKLVQDVMNSNYKSMADYITSLIEKGM